MARPGTLPAGMKLGRYEVLRHLADGGMAQLLLARSTGIEGFERHVVIKRIHGDQARDKQHVDMFLDEARLAASLHHHNIVQVHDVGQENGEYFFAMEYVHGEDLRKLLTLLASRRQQLPLAQIVTIVCGVASGLHYAHEMRAPGGKTLDIVHRDVSPANVLVGYDGNVKVVDFGIAKASQRSAETQSGTLKGKVAYMSPEQCMGLPIDRRADVYALGIVLWELTTVRRLFKGASEFMTMTSIVSGKIPKPSDYRKDLPKGFEAIMLKALATKPGERYQSCEELRLALEEFAHTEGLRTGTTTLATYMVDTFGRRTEPWLIESDDPVIEVVDVDFDGSPSSKTPNPVEIDDLAIPGSVWEAKSSPIMKARERARQTGEPVFRTPAVGVPITKPTADDSSGFRPPSDQPATDSGTPMAWSPSERIEAVEPPPSTRKRWLLAAGIAGPVALIAIVLIATHGRSKAATPTTEIAPAAAPAPAPVADPPADPTPPPAPEPPKPEPVADTTPAAAPAPAPGKAKATKRRPAAKDAKKPKANWDPNALFPK